MVTMRWYSEEELKILRLMEVKRYLLKREERKIKGV